MARRGRRGAPQSGYLDGTGLTPEQVHGVAGRGAPGPLVVRADARRIAAAVDVAVEDDDGNPRFVYLVDDGRQGRRLVGRHDEDVEAVLDKVADVVDLSGAAVVGRTNLHHGILVKHDFTIDFVVHLRAPVVLAALRDADSVDFVPMASGEPRQEQQA